MLTSTDPNGHTTTFTYDADGNQTSETSPRGETTTTAYDADDEPTSATGADGTAISTDYDPDGDVVSQSDGDGHTTTYTYDALERVTAMVSPPTAAAPAGITTGYSYDPAGQLTASTQAGTGGGALTTSYGYDPAGRLTSVGYSDGVTPNVSYSYDAAGRRLSMHDGTGTTSYSYNAVGWLTATTDGAGATVGYSYDLDGNPTSIGYPNGKTVTRSYDADDQLSAVTDWNGQASTFGYDPDGDLTAIGYPNGVTETTDYSHADLVSHMADATAAHAALADYAYSRDADDDLTGVTATGQHAGPNESYTYTPLDQLHDYTSGTTTGAYSYDHAGSAVTLADGSTLTYDAAQEPLTSTAPGGAVTSYTEDQRGDITGIAPAGTNPASLGYDQASRLTSYAKGTTSASYAYNGDGQRTAKTVNGTTSRFVWDPVSGSVPLLLSDGTRSYLYGPNDLPVEQIATAPPPISLAATGSASDPLGFDTTLTAAFNHAAQKGDEILLAVNTLTGQTVTPPAGYTTVGTFAASTQGETTIVYRKTAAGGETAATVSFDQGLYFHTKTVLAMVYRGVDPANPIDKISSGGSSLIADTVTAPSLTTTAPNDQMVLIDSSLNALTANATFTPPAGMTSRAAASVLFAGSAVFDQPKPAIGATGAKTSTVSNVSQLETVLIALRQAPGTLFIQHDQQGSTRLLTDPAGNVDASYNYNPYGVTISHTGTADTPLRYDGQYQDDETGYYYLRARYYDPAIAGFLTRDPLDAVTGSAYAYVNNDPLDLTDPLGMCGHWYDVLACAYHWATAHTSAILKYAAISLIVVGAAATAVETGGTSDLLASTLIADLSEGSSAIAEVSYAGATAADLARAATGACKENIRSADCLASVAEALIGSGASMVTKASVEQIVGKKLAKKIAGPAAHAVEGQLDVLFTDLEAAKQCHKG